MERIILFPQEEYELSVTEGKNYFSRIGFGVLAFFLLPDLIQYPIYFLLQLFAPHLLTSSIVPQLISLCSIYAVGFPVMYFILRSLPRQRPIRDKIPSSEFWTLLCISMACIYIGSRVSSFVNAYLSSILGGVSSNPVGSNPLDDNPWFHYLYVAILAPILEELVFRRFLCSRLLYLGEGCAIFVSAAIFGLCHGNFYQLFYAFAAGLVFAMVYVRTGKLVYTILFHVFINFTGGVLTDIISRNIDFGVISEYLSTQGAERSAELTEAFLGMLPYLAPSVLNNLLSLVMAILGVVFFILRFRSISFRPGEKALPRGKKATCIFGNAGVIVCLVVFALTFMLSALPAV